VNGRTLGFTTVEVLDYRSGSLMSDVMPPL